MGDPADARPRISRSKGQSAPDATQPSIHTQGLVRSNDGKTLVVESDDGRTWTFQISEKTNVSRNGTAIKISELVPRSTVAVDAQADKEQNLTAASISLLKGPAAEPATASEPAAAERELPHVNTLESPADAPGRPILHRGGASKQHTPGDRSLAENSSPEARGKTDANGRYQDDDIIIEPDPAAMKAAGRTGKNNGDELIEKTRTWVNSFSSSLPNFVCQQATTRYMQESKTEGWRAMDVITAQVVYEDGRESYRDITLGGKKTNKTMLELGGSTSTGEFATTLRSLFSPASNANFKRYRSSRSGGADAVIYDFDVDLRHSDWQIRVGGQTLRPAYSGSVWIDRNTAEVRRIEMQADKIPSDFPLDAVEWAVDYNKVLLGNNPFFLPVRAENLGCQRGSSICTKNVVEFRDYHRFSGSSTINFGQ